MRNKFFYIQVQSKVLRHGLISYRWLHLAGMYGNNIQLYATLVPVRIAYSWGGSSPSLPLVVYSWVYFNKSLGNERGNYSTSSRKCEGWRIWICSNKPINQLIPWCLQVIQFVNAESSANAEVTEEIFLV